MNCNIIKLFYVYLMFIILIDITSFAFAQNLSSKNDTCSKLWSEAIYLYSPNYSTANPAAILWKVIDCDKVNNPNLRNRKYIYAYDLLIKYYNMKNAYDSSEYVYNLAIHDSIPIDEINIQHINHKQWQAPSLIGGIESIYTNLIYPKLAKDENIETTVILKVIIDDIGNIRNIMIMKEEGNYGFGIAAVNALNKCKFWPAKANDKSVKSCINIPVKFSLGSMN